MIKQPIAVDRYKDRPDLDKMSRVNFSRSITVDWDVKVKTIGKVAGTSIPALLAYWHYTPQHQ